MVEIARHRKPFMMNVQSDAVIAERMELYRKTVREAGGSAEEAARLAKECWIWRNVVVADTDAEAERIAVPAFTAMNELRTAMRDKVVRDQGLSIAPPTKPGEGPPARTSIEHGLVHGSPATVLRKLKPVLETGVGGMIIQFRLGPMTYDQTAKSLELFQSQVAPALRGSGSG
jgi:alkanesulfonate monooxygenase SsuD/methylene tetrahydromethanopterin reductase-like flavin-dependent oxidoreductase (luciferase family)